METNKIKTTDKVYKVKITPMIEEEIFLRVPKDVELTQEILEDSGYFDGWYNEEPPSLIGGTCRLEIGEVDKELWTTDKDPILDNDGDIHFDY